MYSVDYNKVKLFKNLRAKIVASVHERSSVTILLPTARCIFRITRRKIVIKARHFKNVVINMGIDEVNSHSAIQSGHTCR